MEPKINIKNSAHFSWLLGLYWLLGGTGFPFGNNDLRGKMMGSSAGHGP